MKYGASTLRFPHAKDFRRKLSAIWARAVKEFRQVCPRPTKTFLKNIGLKESPLLGRPHIKGRH